MIRLSTLARWAGLLLALTLPPCSTAAPLSDTVFVAFDLETTGFQPRKERIVEIGAARFRGSKLIATTNWLVNPGCPMPIFAKRVHGISDTMVADAPSIEQILPRFAAFVNGAPLIAHNATFDTQFLSAETSRSSGACPTNTVIDSLVLSRLCYPLSPSHRLEDLTRQLKLGTTGHHRALADAIYVYKLMTVLLAGLDADLTLDELTKMAGTPWPDPSR